MCRHWPTWIKFENAPKAARRIISREAKGAHWLAPTSTGIGVTQTNSDEACQPERRHLINEDTMTKKKYSLTEEHRAQLKPWADKWIANAMSTKAMDDEERELCRRAVVGMYAAAGLKAPRVVFTPSPISAAFAAGFASWIWYCRKLATDQATNQATDQATDQATYQATHQATIQATYQATDQATDQATIQATYQATDQATHQATIQATYQATDQATDQANWYVFGGDMRRLSFEVGADAGGIRCAAKTWNMRQGGNQWSGWDSYLTFFRDVVKLGESHGVDYSKYNHWATLAEHSGPRYVHPEFCIISDRPELLTVDEQNRPHGESGPFCRWRDGSALYAWHGTYVPAHWIEHKDKLDPKTALTHENLEQRRAACEIIGWSKVLAACGAKVIDEDKDPEIGTLLEADLPDSPGSRFLRVKCGTGRDFVLAVPAEMTTALDANSWTYGVDPKEFRIEVRT